MNRRSVLSRVALAATAAPLAGCLGDPLAESGPRNPPSGPDGDGGARQTPPDEEEEQALYVVTFDFEPAADETVAVPVTVANRSATDKTGLVTCTLRAGDETFEQSETVDLPAGGDVSFEFHFEILFEEFAIDGGVTVDVTEV
ncbi:MAG: hypothetical protein ACQETB_04320 [Halobacteriota archaeon]